MSAARLPYYQQQPEQDEGDEEEEELQQRRRNGGGGGGGYHDSRPNRRERSRSIERRRYSRSRSRSVDRQRRRYSRDRDRRNQHRYHRDSRDRSWERDRERKRSYSRRYGYYQRDSRSASPPALSYFSRRQQQLYGSKQGKPVGGGLIGENGRVPLATNAAGKDKAMSAVGAYYNLDTDEPFDKERIHREIEEKLRETLAREGKVYPPPKQEASHPVFANDGSFMELFKKMQEEQQRPSQQQPSDAANQPSVTTAAAAAVAATMREHQLEHSASVSAFGALPAIAAGAASSAAAPYIAAAAAGKSAPPPPMVGRRRGGKILKTGMVAKLKAPNDRDVDPKDFWSLYLAEVNKYKSNACDTDNGKRPLVK